MCRTLLSLLTAAFVVSVAGCGSAQSQPNGGASERKEERRTKSLDLSYIPSDCFAALIVHPQQMRKTPALAPMTSMVLRWFDSMASQQMKNTPSLASMSKTDLFLSPGFTFFMGSFVLSGVVEPPTIEQEIVLLGPSGPEEELPSNSFPITPTGIFRFAEPFDSKFRELLRQEMGEVRYRGETYYGGKLVAGFYFPNERTLVVSTESNLRKIISGKVARSPLIELLRDADADNHVIGAVVFEPARAALDELSEDMQHWLPGNLDDLTRAPDLMKSATLTARVDGDPLIKLELAASNAASAVKLHELAKKGHDWVRQQYDKNPQAIVEDVPPALVQPLAKFVDQLLDGFGMAKEGHRLVVSLKRPASTADFLERLASERALGWARFRVDAEKRRTDARARAEQQARGPVVVTTTKHGELRERDLNELRTRRRAVSAFLKHATSRAADGPQERQSCETRFPELENWVVVRTWLQARYAAAHGLRVEPAEVDEFLKEQTGKALADPELQALLQKLSLSREALLEELSQQLLSFKAARERSNAAPDVSDADLWECFLRERRTAEIEVVPVEVERFVNDLSVLPSEAALREFFAAYRGRYPDPASPEPGFRQPRRLASAYLHAKACDLAKPDEVTEEEIRRYYGENREDFKRVSSPPVSEEPLLQPASDLPSEPDTEGMPAEQDAKPEDERLPSTNAYEQSSEKTSGASDDPPPRSDGLPAEHNAEPRVQPSPSIDQDGQFSENERLGASGRLSPLPGGPPVDDAKPESVEVPSWFADAIESWGVPQTETEWETPPLDEVRDEIRQWLALETARGRIPSLLDQLALQVESHGKAMIRHEKREIEPPEPPDWAALAREHGLIWGRTELITFREANSLGFGKLGDDGRPFFVTAAFTDPVKYQPRRVFDPASDGWYLVWVTDIEEEHIPHFDEPQAREETARAWRMCKARTLAKAEAIRLAGLARDSEVPLRMLFRDRPDVTVVTPAPFSWLSTSLDRLWSLSVSEVEGIPHAGVGFMRAIFELEEGDVTVVANQPQTVFYVVRLDRFSPSTAKLRAILEIERYRSWHRQTIQDEQSEAWRRRIDRETGYRLIRDPSSPLGFRSGFVVPSVFGPAGPPL